MSLSQIDWQIIANIGSSIAVLVAIIVFVWEIHANRQEHMFEVFIRYFDMYKELVNERKAQWKIVKDTIHNNPKTTNEINDRTSSLDYLMLRAKQDEPFYAIEHGIIEREIESLNVLNEMCVLASKDPKKQALVGLQFAKDISYYQNRLDDLLFLVNRESQQRLFPIPRYSDIKKFPTNNYYQSMPM